MIHGVTQEMLVLSFFEGNCPFIEKILLILISLCLLFELLVYFSHHLYIPSYFGKEVYALLVFAALTL